MINLSRSGAQLRVDHAPAPGSPALLKWEKFEAMGQVVWVRPDCCGVRFDRLLPETAIIESVESAEPRTGPVASVSRIPPGNRRRSRSLQETEACFNLTSV